MLLYYKPIAWRTIADIIDFHLDFSFAVNNDTVGGNRQPWHTKFKKFMLFLYFSIFAFMNVQSKPTNIMFVDTTNKNGKQIL